MKCKNCGNENMDYIARVIGEDRCGYYENLNEIYWCDICGTIVQDWVDDPEPDYEIPKETVR